MHQNLKVSQKTQKKEDNMSLKKCLSQRPTLVTHRITCLKAFFIGKKNSFIIKPCNGIDYRLS